MSAPHILETRVHADGTQSAQAASTPTADQRGCEMHVLPTRAIPVVFIPGIMGSNLRLSAQRRSDLKKDDNLSWRPEATMDTLAMIFKSPAQRQMMLDPEATEIDRYDLNAPDADKRHKNVSGVSYIHVPGGTQGVQDKVERDRQARLRGWSEVMFSSYGDLLQTLESRLNQMCIEGRPRGSWTSGKREAVGVDPKRWGATGGNALTAEELGTVSDAWYPVHAIGYNWLRSNGEAAQDVAQRIREIIAFYKKLKFDCSKVIVVTHSMGGLVGRALIHPDYGNAQDVVAGVVHGAMPAVGAAAAYKRIRMGFEGSGIEGYIAKKVLGDTGPKVTAVLANSAGGLQLLPSERYGADWLKASVDGKKVMSLPKSDPYAEIYTVQDKWYRLINPEWINPALAKGPSVDETNIRLLQAQEFHQDIGAVYHPETYLSYGMDEKQKAWGDITWHTMRASIFGGGMSQMLVYERLSIESPAANWLVIDDDGDGAIVLNDGLPQNDPGQRFRAEIEEPAQIGDGTVPAERSAQEPVRQGKARVAFQQTGYEHQNSYKDDAVMSSTLHAICKIALTSFTWKSCP
jgi:pimeloyl-ACP methyl ester carboxylesterase